MKAFMLISAMGIAVMTMLANAHLLPTHKGPDVATMLPADFQPNRQSETHAGCE